MDATPDTLQAAGHQQLLAAVQLALVVVATALVLHGLVESRALADWAQRAEERILRVSRQKYTDDNYYIDFEDRLVNQELPAADYSRGGVYLFGTSNLKWATRFWELPPKERALIHNYGMGSCNHGYQFQFLRYLVEHAGLLSAGGEKTMVIFGLSYHCAGTVCDPAGFFPNVWTRHGLFTYSEADGITPRKVNPLWRYVHFQRIRIAGCFRTIASILAHQLGWHAAPRKQDPALYNRERQEWMGPDWRAKIDSQLAQFRATLDYLQARRVRIAVVFLPQGSWEKNLPYEAAYEQAVTRICQEKSVPVDRWPNLVTDDDFADSNHFNPYGVDKLQPAFLNLALPFLHSTGALP